MTEDCLRIRGTVLTTLFLDILNTDLESFEQQLSRKVEAAADFFQQSPVIINLDNLNEKDNDLSVTALLDCCRRCGLRPIGFKASEIIETLALSEAIKATGLAILNEPSKRKDNTAAKQPEEKSEPAANQNKPSVSSKLIDKPIRSGQQVYADKGDLIILGSVSGGAEVLADGNIHIYGSLRGRALAGVNGNTAARVFCHKNEAELVSIAGHFLLSESLEQQAWQQAAQFFLDEERLQVQAL